jgi:soluble lytic murein transglycosylase-like protein
MTREIIQTKAEHWAKRYSVSPWWLLSAVVQIESSFRPLARGKAGEYGLGQIMPGTIRDFEKRTGKTVTDPFDVDQNLEVAAWYLGSEVPRMLRAYSKDVTVKNILWAYNAGIGNLVKGNLPASTVSYISKVQGQLAVFAPSVINSPGEVLSSPATVAQRPSLMASVLALVAGILYYLLK